MHNGCQLDPYKYAETLDQVGDPDTQAYLYARPGHYDALETNIMLLDSGPAHHVHNAVVVTDSKPAQSLIGINGNISWPQMTVYIPITLKDSDGQMFNLES